MSNETTKRNILVDTSIPLEGGEEIIAKLEKVAPVFVTDIVLQELDGHKNNSNSSVAYRAREFFRKLGNSNGIELDVLPLSGMRLEKTDTLRKMFLGAIPLHVIVRKPYKSRDINDSKIIEVAKDYNMTLVTLDTAQRVRGLSDGVNAVTLEAILPQAEKMIMKGETMSEIEKMMKNEKARSKESEGFPLGATLGFLIIGAICSLGANSFWDTFSIISSVILFFAFVSMFAKPSKQEESSDTSELSSINQETYNPLNLDLRNDIVR